MNSIPRKSPDLLLRPVSDDFAYAVNCSYPNSFRLLNKRQQEILEAVNGIDDVQAISDKLALPPDSLEQFLSMLGKTEIVSFDGFTVPKKPAATKSLNFWIHTTNACNLGCSYCYISTLNTGKGMTDAVRQQLLYKLLEAVETKGIRHIRLRLAGGEPMGQFNVWKIFIPEAKQALADAGCKFDVGFLTNLTLLNDEIIAFSKEHDPTDGGDNTGGGGGGGGAGGGTAVAPNRVTIAPNTPNCLSAIANALLTLANYNFVLDQLAQQEANQSYNPYSDVKGILSGLARRDDWNVIVKVGNIPLQTDYNNNTYQANANTLAEHGHITITVDSSYLATASQLAVARTLIHEYLHAYFEYGIEDANASPSVYTEFQLMNSYLYNKKDQPDDTEDNQHEQIASRYVGQLGNLLEQYAKDNHISSPDPNLTIHEYAMDMAWGGLKGTSAYRKYAQDKSRIEREINNEQVHNSNSSTQKACN